MLFPLLPDTPSWEADVAKPHDVGIVFSEGKKERLIFYFQSKF